MVRLRVAGADLPLAPGGGLLLHQLHTVEALERFPVVFNTAPTGAGKTLAALNSLVRRSGESALLVAPTNALIDQHVADAREFIRREGLSLKVIPLTGLSLDGMMTEIRSSGLEGIWRRGKVLHRLLDRSGAQLVVTNPDIFYAMLFAQYSRLDQRNLLTEILAKFATIIIDEFHYYNAKQLFAFEFFLLLLREIGAFDQGRRMLLLTATPSDEVRRTLEALGVAHGLVDGEGFRDLQGSGFVGEGPAVVEGRVAVAGWPATRADSMLNNGRGLLDSRGAADRLPVVRTPFLSALELELRCDDGGIEGYLEGPGLEKIRQWLGEGKDGVVISNSLARINRVYRMLVEAGIRKARMRRITGPVSREEREDYGGRSLLLATPTVDIGFNFSNLAKRRQNIDFVVTEAETRDELLQRLGRAGRLLWNKECPWPSEAVAIVPRDVCAELAESHGSELSRSGLVDLLEGAMPEKAFSGEYRARYGLLEAARPIDCLWRQATADTRKRVEKIFDEVRQIYAPRSRRSFFSLRRRIRDAETAVSHAVKVAASKLPGLDGLPDSWQRDFLRLYADSSPPLRNLDEARRAILCKTIEKNPLGLLRGLLENADGWANGREVWRNYLLERAVEVLGLFAFRDAFSSPAVPIFDPRHYLSDSDQSLYSVLHVLRHYRCRFLEAEERRRLLGKLGERISDLPALELVEEFPSPERLVFRLDRFFESQEQFDGKLYRVAGLAGLCPKVEAQPVCTQIEALFQKAVPALLFPVDSEGTRLAAGFFRQRKGWMYDIEAIFQDDTTQRYQAVLGTNAYFLHARYHMNWKRLAEAPAAPPSGCWVV